MQNQTDQQKLMALDKVADLADKQEQQDADKEIAMIEAQGQQQQAEAPQS